MSGIRTPPGRRSTTKPTSGRSGRTTFTWSARPCTTRCRFASPAPPSCAAATASSSVASTRQWRGRRSPERTDRSRPRRSWPPRRWAGCSRTWREHPTASTRCACWSTPARPAPRRSSGRPWSGSGPTPCGSSTDPPRASSPCAPRPSGQPTRARWAGPDPAGPSRSTTTAPSGAGPRSSPASPTGATTPRRRRPGATARSPSVTSVESTGTATSSSTAAATTSSSPEG